MERWLGHNKSKVDKASQVMSLRMFGRLKGGGRRIRGLPSHWYYVEQRYPALVHIGGFLGIKNPFLLSM